MDGNKLSKRLEKVATYVNKGARMADIGSDHAYLPVYLAKQQQIDFAIAGEVVKGPFLNAKQEVEKEGLAHVIDVRLADGLKAVNLEDNINVVTICGMGGPLIRDILNSGKEKLENKPRLILQPNVGEKDVRVWLQENHYKIIDEDILEEDKHIYEIMVAEYTSEQTNLSEAELLFGKYLLGNKNEVFRKKWHKELEKINKVRVQLKQAKQIPEQKIAELDNLQSLIEGALND